MKTQINTDGNTTDREIVISRVFDAPRELVWEAMANPDHVVNWLGAARIYHDNRGHGGEAGRRKEARHARAGRDEISES